jgi:hypothetical protein
MSWVSVHAFYHGDLDVLLLRGVRPLVEDLRRASLIDGFFFLRYWDGGPHLRVRLSAADSGRVRAAALRRLGDYLTACPSDGLPDLSGYAQRAARLAADEAVVDYLRVPEPSNTVREIAYRPETDRYGEGESLAVVERHFVESSRIAFGLIAAGTTRGQRHLAAFSALLLAWHGRQTAPPAPAADDAEHDEDERRYLDQRDVLAGLAGQTARISAGTSTLPASGALTAWWRSISTLPDPAVRDLCAHLFCNRLGVGPGEERRLRYLARRTLTSEAHVDQRRKADA